MLFYSYHCCIFSDSNKYCIFTVRFTVNQRLSLYSFVGRVGADNAIYFALGTSKISISPTKILFFEKVFA